MPHVLILATHHAPAAARLVERITSQLTADLRPGDRITHCGDLRRIVEAVQQRPDIVLAPLAYEGEGGFEAAVTAVRHLMPTIPIVACCDVSVGADALLTAERARVSHFAVPAVDDVATIVRDVMGTAQGTGTARRSASPPPANGTQADALDELLAALSSLPARLLMAAVSDRPPRTVPELAAGVGMAERTLTRRCARYGWPTPTMILRYGLLLRGMRVALATGSMSAGAVAAGCEDAHGRAVEYFRGRLNAATNGAMRQPLAEGLVPLCTMLAERFGVVAGGERPRRRPTRTRSPRRPPLPPDRPRVEEGGDDGPEGPGGAKLQGPAPGIALELRPQGAR